MQAKSDDELAREKAWMDAGRVWLQYRDGFAAGRILNDANDADSAFRTEGIHPPTTGESGTAFNHQSSDGLRFHLYSLCWSI